MRSLTDQEDGLVAITSAYTKPVGQEAMELLENNFAKDPARYPTGETEMTAAVYLMVLPIDERENVLLTKARFEAIPQLRDINSGDTGGRPFSAPWSKLENDVSIWNSIGGGEAWLEKLAGFQDVSHLRRWPSQLPRQKIDIREGQLTLVRAEIPDGIEAEIRKAIEETTNAAQFAELIGQGLLRRPVKISLAGYEVIKTDTPKKAAPSVK